MSSNARGAARRLAPPAFAAATTGWLAGLNAIQDSASSLALLLATACGIAALASLVTWQRARGPAA